MLKFAADIKAGTLHGFGLSEANLNRLQFNQEPILFDFGFVGRPDLFGLIAYLDEYQEPIDISNNLDAAKKCCLPVFDLENGITPETLFFFPIARCVMEKFRSTPFWAFPTHVQITGVGDKQLFFAGRTEAEIEEYFQKAGFISTQTKQTYKGFGKRD